MTQTQATERTMCPAWEPASQTANACPAPHDPGDEKGGTDRPIRLCDKRDFSCQWTEPLAMKLIRDEIIEAGLPPHFLRNVLLFYLALTELAAMRRSDGFQLHTNDIHRLSGVDQDAHVQCRQFLEDLRLIRVEEKMVKGGGRRKTVFVYLLPAPYAGSREPNRDGFVDRPLESATKGPSEGRSQGADSHQPNYRSNGSSDTDANSGSSLRSLPSLGASRGSEIGQEPTENAPQSDAVVGRQQQASSLPSGGVRVSLKSWTREMIRAHHRVSPGAPPPGTQCAQAVMCAMATTPRADEVLAVDFGRAYSRVAAALTWPYRKEFILTYTDWMDAALALDAVPRPVDGAPSLEYWLAVMVAETIRRTTAAYERNHDEAQDDSGADLLSDADMNEILDEALRVMGGGRARRQR
jgi:hypothetical protein